MIRVQAFVRLLLLLTCISPFFSAHGADRYRVTLVLYPGDDSAAVAKRLAAAYHGQLETPVGDDGTFTIALSSATASLLSHDPQVTAVRRVASAAPAWSLGTYQYDDAGNIRNLGSSVFVYDAENRLSYEKTGTQKRQALTYDGFGNIRTITEGGVSYTVGASPTSNRADVPSSAGNHMHGTYDLAGNMITSAANTYTYDALNVMTKSTTDVSRAYIYNANDERIGTITLTGPTGSEVSSQWTIRDPAGQVLRRFSRQGTDWRWMQDYIYRDGRMLASESNDQIKTLHYHLDHLGTPRLITGNGGIEIARHTYHPFGEEVPGATPQVAEPKKFTGHERDAGGLDYMHARYYDYRMGRFLSVDSAMDFKKILPNPKRWNRYSYVSNDPINKVDPDGREENFYMEKLFREQQMVGEGHMTEAEYWDRRRGEGMGALAGAAGAAVIAVGPAAWSAAGQFLFRHLEATTLTMVLLGGGATATHQSLQRAAQGGGPTVQVVTNLTQAPAAGRALSTAVGEGAQALANAARSGPGVRTFTANIPQVLIKGLQQAGLLEVRKVTMNGVTGTEYRFAAGAAQYIREFFREKQQ